MMTRGMLWFLLLNNAIVLALCAYYIFQGEILYWEEGTWLPQFTMPTNPSGRAIGLIPFVFSFAYLIYMLKTTGATEVKVNALDAPAVSAIELED